MSRNPALRISHDELIVDNFAGGGGASLGIEWALGRSPDIAINHDPEAIAMHRANHPSTMHFTSNVWDIDPAVVCRGRPVGFAWFSPDCTFHSKARGGKPFRDRDLAKRIRGLAWVVVRWIKAVKPRVLGLENVEEFEDWGPLLDDGMPCPKRKGFTFQRWWKMIENLGYRIEAMPLVGAEYGAPTTRRRLFIIARRDGQPIVWPQPTHGGTRKPFRTAAECIDFWRPTHSIFLTKDQARKYNVRRPLADNTMRRIARGMQKFVIDNPEPFIVPVKTWGGGGNDARSTHLPHRTITASKRGEYALVTPYLARIGQTGGNGNYCNDVRGPVTTVTSKAEHLLLAPYMVPRYGEREGQAPRTLTVENPMPAIVPTRNGAQLVTAFLAQHNGGFYEGCGRRADAPVSTITQAGSNQQLVASHIVRLKGTCKAGQQLTLPLGAVQAQGNHYAQVNAFLLKYYGTDQDPRLEEPMHTLTAKDRMSIVMVQREPYVIADIGMRMLHPRELFRAQGFPDDYVIDLDVDGKPLTKEAQVRMVGNSVCPPVAAALARAQFEDQVIEVVA